MSILNSSNPNLSTLDNMINILKYVEMLIKEDEEYFTKIDLVGISNEKKTSLENADEIYIKLFYTGTYIKYYWKQKSHLYHQYQSYFHIVKKLDNTGISFCSLVKMNKNDPFNILQNALSKFPDLNNKAVFYDDKVYIALF